MKFLALAALVATADAAGTLTDAEILAEYTTAFAATDFTTAKASLTAASACGSEKCPD